MYKGDYWVSAELCTYDGGAYYYVCIEEIYPACVNSRGDINHFDVLKGISCCHRDGVFTDMEGMRKFVKECVPFSYEMVLENLMRIGAFRCRVDIPSCLLDE